MPGSAARSRRPRHGTRPPAPPARRWMAAALAVLATLLLAACSGDRASMQQSPLLRFVERKSGRIAIMGSDGNIYTMDQAGGGRVPVTVDAVIPDQNRGLIRYYQFPAWSPDDSRLAFIGYQGNDQIAATSSVFTTAPDGTNIVQAFSSGQYLPHTLYWSPDGRRLTFLTSTAGSTASALQIVPAAGGEATKLDAGNPFYWSWAPDATTIVVHAGGSGAAYRSRLAFLNVDGTVYEEGLAVRPAAFQTPAWSPDGSRLLVAAQAGDQAELVMTNRDGSLYRVLHRARTAPTFAWSPDGNRVAYITRTIDEEGVQANLQVVDTEARATEPLVLTEETLVIGFFWSPDSEKIAYFVPGNVRQPGRRGAADPVPHPARAQPAARRKPRDSQFRAHPASSCRWCGSSTSSTSPPGCGRRTAATSCSPRIRSRVPASWWRRRTARLAPRRVADGLIGFWSWH